MINILLNFQMLDLDIKIRGLNEFLTKKKMYTFCNVDWLGNLVNYQAFSPSDKTILLEFIE
jgi:hypothetical protein